MTAQSPLENHSTVPNAGPLAAERKVRLSKALADLDSKRRLAVLRRAKETPSSLRQAYRRAATGLSSPKAAIRAFCYMCIGYERLEITKCSAYGCPLWCYRPYQKG